MGEALPHEGEGKALEMQWTGDKKTVDRANVTTPDLEASNRTIQVLDPIPLE